MFDSFPNLIRFIPIDSIPDSMVDRVDSKKRSWIMSRVRSRDTGLELRVRSALWHEGLRFRKQFGEYHIDIAFPRSRVAVFVDSCFWHGCPEHFRIPKTNIEFWKGKIERNRRRDVIISRKLRHNGWLVFRLWEHQINTDLPSLVDQIRKSVRSK